MFCCCCFVLCFCFVLFVCFFLFVVFWFWFWFVFVFFVLLVVFLWEMAWNFVSSCYYCKINEACSFRLCFGWEISSRSVTWLFVKKIKQSGVTKVVNCRNLTKYSKKKIFLIFNRSCKFIFNIWNINSKNVYTTFGISEWLLFRWILVLMWLNPTSSTCRPIAFFSDFITSPYNNESVALAFIGTLLNLTVTYTGTLPSLSRLCTLIGHV